MDGESEWGISHANELDLIWIEDDWILCKLKWIHHAVEDEVRQPQPPKSSNPFIGFHCMELMSSDSNMSDRHCTSLVNIRRFVRRSTYMESASKIERERETSLAQLHENERIHRQSIYDMNWSKFMKWWTLVRKRVEKWGVSSGL